jgi:septal ring factor EnvC (AmiA/AmiB activator)
MHIDPIIFSALSALATIVGVGVFIGVLKTKVDNNAKVNEDHAKRLGGCAAKEDLAALAKRADEDREQNVKTHEKLFASVNDQSRQVAELKATLDSLRKSLDEVKIDIKQGLKDIQDELKELRRRP